MNVIRRGDEGDETKGEGGIKGIEGEEEGDG